MSLITKHRHYFGFYLSGDFIHGEDGRNAANSKVGGINSKLAKVEKGPNYSDSGQVESAVLKAAHAMMKPILEIMVS